MQHVFVALLVVEKLGITFGEIFFKTKQFFLNFWLLRLIFASKNPQKRGRTIFSMRFLCKGGIKLHFELFYRCFPKNHKNQRNYTLIGFLTHCARVRGPLINFTSGIMLWICIAKMLNCKFVHLLLAHYMSTKLPDIQTLQMRCTANCYFFRLAANVMAIKVAKLPNIPRMEIFRNQIAMYFSTSSKNLFSRVFRGLNISMFCSFLSIK